MNGTLYLLPFVEEVGKQHQELWAIGYDGAVLWRTTPALAGGNGSEEDPVTPHQTQAPIIVPDGSVIVGCTTCVVGRAGLGRYGPSTGDAIFISETPWSSPFAEFGGLVWDGEKIWYNLLLKTYATTPDGEVTPQTHSVDLATRQGDVWVGDRTGDTVLVHWGDQMIDVNVVPFVDSGSESVDVRVLMAVEPAGLVLSVEASSGADLVLVNMAGDVLWHRDSILLVSASLPAIVDGMIVYVDDGTRSIVTEEFPAQRVAEGPWPILGGTAGNTRSAEAGS